MLLTNVNVCNLIVKCHQDQFHTRLAITSSLTEPLFVRMANHGIRPRIKTRPQSSVCLQQRESSVRLVMYCWKAPRGLSGVCPLHTNSSQSKRCCPPKPGMDQPTAMIEPLIKCFWWRVDGSVWSIEMMFLTLENNYNPSGGSIGHLLSKLRVWSCF